MQSCPVYILMNGWMKEWMDKLPTNGEIANAYDGCGNNIDDFVWKEEQREKEGDGEDKIPSCDPLASQLQVIFLIISVYEIRLPVLILSFDSKLSATVNKLLYRTLL